MLAVPAVRFAIEAVSLAPLVAVLALLPIGLYRQVSSEPVTGRTGIGVASAAAAAALATLGVGWGAPPLIAAPAAAAAAACATVVFSDAKFYLVPDVCTIAILGAAIARAFAAGWQGPLFGAALAGGLLALIRYVARLRGVDGMGMGDVKLAAAVGSLLGAERVVWALLMSSVAGIIWGLLANRRQCARVEVPYGAMLSGVTLCLLWGGLAGGASASGRL